MRFPSSSAVAAGAWLLLGLGAAGCTVDPGLPPARFVALPWSDEPFDQDVLAARALVERGAPRAGLDVLERVLAAAPRHVDALRLRQDVLRERGRRARLQVEAEALQAHGDEPLGDYLFGRVAQSAAARETAFQRAAAASPGTLWPWLGVASQRRRSDPAGALALYRQLYRASDGHPLVAVPFGSLLREQRAFDEALQVYQALAADPRVPGAGVLGSAQALLGAEQEAAAWPLLLEALRQRPHDDTVQALLGSWLRTAGGADRHAAVVDVLRAEPAVVAGLAQGGGLPLLVELLERSRQVPAALAVLAAAPAPRSPALRRLERRLLLAVGEVGAFLRLLREDAPAAVVTAEANELRGRWQRLFGGPWYSAPERLQEAAVAVELLQALRDTGFLVEVEQLAGWFERQFPGHATAVTALRDEVRDELAFEASLRGLLGRSADDPMARDLDAVLVALRAESLRIFGRDVVGEVPIFTIPLVGAMADPFAGGLAGHLDRYNRHLVLGSRAFGVAEGLLFSRWSRSELPPQVELPLAGRCREVIGFDRDIKPLHGVVGGDIAGIALWNHFLVDHDAVRDWAATVRDRRRIAAEDGGALATDPLPASPGLDPFEVSWRLALRSPVADQDLEAAVLDTIRHHERQHLVDAFHHLPFEHNPLRGLALLFRSGWSPLTVQGEMERRAELASLALSPHTELVLAHIADFLGQPDVESPHHLGFGELGRQLVAGLLRHGVPPAAAAPAAWDRLDMALVRRIARELLQDLP